MEKKELISIWEKILNSNTIRENVAEVALKQWIQPLELIEFDESSMILEVPNKFHQDYVEKYYLIFIKDALFEINNINDINVIFTIKDNDSFEKNENSQEQSLFFVESLYEKEKEEKNFFNSVKPGDDSTLNPRYTFDTFVTGNSNRFAHAAAQAIAEKPGSVYNPFFIYGGVGLGKTHLMHAIGHEIIKHNPNSKILYISSEKFTNEMINSIRNNTTESFRKKYRHVDVLMVDDVQFLYKKERTQEEFFYTFEELYGAGKQIILTSDRPPREIETLEDRLRSRFEWGLQTDIQTPDLETRVAILKKKATLENISVPTDGLFYIAGRIDSNIRELEGALTRVIAYASINKLPITNELIAEAMVGIGIEKTKKIDDELIKEIVSSFFNVKVDDLSAKKRTRELVFPRQIAMYLCRQLTDMSLPSIGQSFGGRDHTTVIHACEKIEADRKDDQKLDTSIKDLMQRLQKM